MQGLSYLGTFNSVPAFAPAAGPDAAAAAGPPPLWLLCLLRAGPLMPCLRLLCCNDSLMDITARRRLYAPLLQLLTLLAGGW